jgi:hypothetical protein
MHLVNTFMAAKARIAALSCLMVVSFCARVDIMVLLPRQGNARLKDT